MRPNQKLILIFGFLMIPFLAASQGCSDAGFCTMGAMKPSQDFNKNTPLKLRSISLGLYEGQSNTSAIIRAGLLDFGLTINGQYDLQVKVPYMNVRGNLGSTSGIGDISLSLTKNLKSNPEFDIMGTVGAKIPTNRSDMTVSGREAVLPMYYQTSLGTYDIIAGASFINREWLISAGYQQPIIHQNENTFRADEDLWDWYEGGMDYVREHNEARNLKRGADIMMRFERNFRMSRFNFNVGLLPIYRITKDQGLDENDEYVELEGTTGLALSALAGLNFKFNVFSSINLIYGHRITDREYNPDGLTRKHVINLNYTYNF
ncbi:hypothetical protein SAMN05661096_00814 [Marivirga sericea]|uniref:MetA-pathway of phenol degradation n=1 Tax=Marivirga sericea TaxID=1028 RepID=A0A1X7ILN0_9BACT|nr:hypothetical protein [Marivirga sericea]SMG15883.1 hypothetical protein SAMN05661096_00814 [Marivirga sericea]